MDTALYPAAPEMAPLQKYRSDFPSQSIETLDTLAAQSPNLAKWRVLAADGRIVSSYVLIGPRTEAVPIRLGLIGGIRISDFLSTISIAKVLVELDLAPLAARDFALFAYPVANPGRAAGTDVDFENSFWKGSSDPVIRFFERELTTGGFDGVIAVRSDEPVAGFQIQISSGIIGKEVLWHTLELPQKMVPLASEPIRILRPTEDARHSFTSFGHLCPGRFSLVIRTPKNAPAENQISAIAFTIKQILLDYRSLVSQVDRI
jgi:hypothetical protein